MNREGQDRPLAVVTGAAHRVGLAIATALAARGYAIGLHYHASEDLAHQAAAQIEALGAPVLLLPADLTDEHQIVAMFEQVTQAVGLRLSVLVNSAAVMAHGDLRTMSAAEWDHTLALNLRAPWLCSQLAARLMQPDGGCIINITDTGANRSWTGYPVYTLSKAGLQTLTTLLAKALAPAIRVNAVAPGLVMAAPGLPEEEWQRLVRRLPLQRPGSPESVVQAVYYLLDNDYVTGQTLVVDGGYQLI